MINLFLVILLLFSFSAQADTTEPVVEHINGVSFVHSNFKNTDIFTSISKISNEIVATVIIVNKSNRIIRFDPDQISATVNIKNKKNETEIRTVPLKIYSAQQYEKKLATGAAWAAALYGFGQGLANVPTATTSSFSAQTSNGQFVYGDITQQPSYADRIVANAHTQANIENFVSNLNSSNLSQTSVLLRKHTLLPKTTYGGVVHIKKMAGNKTDTFSLTIPVENESAKIAFYINKKEIIYTGNKSH